MALFLPLALAAGVAYLVFSKRQTGTTPSSHQLPPGPIPTPSHKPGPASYPNWESAWSTQAHGALTPAGDRFFTLRDYGVTAYESPNAASPSLEALPPATPVVAIDVPGNEAARAAGWWLVSTPTGVQGYVPAVHLVLDIGSPQAGSTGARAAGTHAPSAARAAGPASGQELDEDPYVSSDQGGNPDDSTDTSTSVTRVVTLTRCWIRPEPRPWDDRRGRQRGAFSVPKNFPMVVVAHRPGGGWMNVRVDHPAEGPVEGWVEVKNLGRL